MQDEAAARADLAAMVDEAVKEGQEREELLEVRFEIAVMSVAQ